MIDETKEEEEEEYGDLAISIRQRDPSAWCVAAAEGRGFWFGCVGWGW